MLGSNEVRTARHESPLGAVWQPRIALALSGVGFGAIMAFSALLFIDHRWAPVWAAFSAMSFACIGGRLFFGIAGGAGIDSVYLVSAIIALVAAVLTLQLRRQRL